MTSVPRGPVRAADLVARSVMFPEPGRVSELVAALRPAVPPPSSRPDDGSAAATADGSAEAARGPAAEEPSTEAEADQQQGDKVEGVDLAPEASEDAPRSAAAATSSSLANSIVSLGAHHPATHLLLRACCSIS